MAWISNWLVERRSWIFDNLPRGYSQCFIWRNTNSCSCYQELVLDASLQNIWRDFALSNKVRAMQLQVRYIRWNIHTEFTLASWKRRVYFPKVPSIIFFRWQAIKRQQIPLSKMPVATKRDKKIVCESCSKNSRSNNQAVRHVWQKN